jgi:meso-butanediol dehydrogenase/(S,S)-butanediol dehydrogenase/diacetyl reductase
VSGRGRFDARVALITGAGSGIGEATARRLAAEGARVVIVDREAERATRVASAIREDGGEARDFEADVGDPRQIEAMIEFALKTFSRLDLLHNNAAHGEFALIADLALEAWNRTLAVVLTAPFVATKLALPIMIRQRHGVIINTASVAGLFAEEHLAPYCTAKAGLIHFTRCTAVENARHGIRANVVCPGTIATPTLLSGVARNPAVRARMEGAQPLGRLGKAEEIASLVAYLASDEAAFITGANYVVDGGSTIGRGIRLVDEAS